MLIARKLLLPASIYESDLNFLDHIINFIFYRTIFEYSTLFI